MGLPFYILEDLSQRVVMVGWQLGMKEWVFYRMQGQQKLGDRAKRFGRLLV